MGDLTLVLALIVVILVVYMFLGPKMENFVNEMNWMTMSRGLSASNADGYNPVITKLSEMERTNAANIVL
jgi:hypothetical protein